MHHPGYQTNAMQSLTRTFPNGRTLVIDPPNYQAMYNVRLWGPVKDGLPTLAKIAIGGCESLEEVIAEAETWAESID